MGKQSKSFQNILPAKTSFAAHLLHLVTKQFMEKKVFGIILTILGIAGLIAAAMSFVNSSGGSYNIKMIIVYLILGLIFFFSGIGLMKTTKDRSV